MSIKKFALFAVLSWLVIVPITYSIIYNIVKTPSIFQKNFTYTDKKAGLTVKSPAGWYGLQSIKELDSLVWQIPFFDKYTDIIFVNNLFLKATPDMKIIQVRVIEDSSYVNSFEDFFTPDPLYENSFDARWVKQLFILPEDEDTVTVYKAYYLKKHKKRNFMITFVLSKDTDLYYEKENLIIPFINNIKFD